MLSLPLRLFACLLLVNACTHAGGCQSRQQQARRLSSQSSFICKRDDFPATTALHDAAKNGDTESLGLLLANPDDPTAINAFNNLGNTPLHLAVFNRQIEAVRLLVDVGASITVKNNFGSGLSPIELATSNTDRDHHLEKTDSSYLAIALYLNSKLEERLACSSR